MKVNAKALIETCAINCTKAEFIEATKSFVFQPARLAFVTPENLDKIEPAGLGQRPQQARYGDALILWTDHAGAQRAIRVAAGQDAAVQIRVTLNGKTQMLPFTGLAMLTAREKLPLVDHATVTQDQRRALAGIQSVMGIIMANPDPARFQPIIIGNAFASAMLDAMGSPKLPVSIEEFGRKARADLIRAKLTRVDPDHPDGFLPLRPLQGVLDDFGIGAFSGASEMRSGRMIINEAALRRVAAANHGLRDRVFATLTSTAVDKLSASPMTPEDFDILADGLSSHRLSGRWINAATDRLTAVMRANSPSYCCDVAFYSIDNRDILAIRDIHEYGEGLAYAYSWPTIDRLPAASIDGVAIVNLSPEEVPAEDEVTRLQSVLDLVDFSASSDVEFSLDGVTPAQKSLRRR